MCGRYAIATPHFSRIEQVLGTTFQAVQPRYNIAPTQNIPIIRQTEHGYELTELRWGLIPFWSKTPTTEYSTFNARIETVATKPAFRGPFRTRRCLIPASGLYEWKQEGGKKQPYFITGSDDEGIALAGLWDEWRDSSGFTLASCTILVGPANGLIAPIHDRLAIILPESACATWLDPNTSIEHASALLHPYPADQMRCWPVSTAVNQARNNTPELIDPI
ncbi:MAG: SOS response-associated peptidase [Propionivibrio sp.]|nr:SOS response-associated peptidase [Propionivibrio sp.]